MEQHTSTRGTTALLLTASVAIALALRVLPAWHAVFAPALVNFQEPDAWFHMRTIHNLLAHFPHRSAFDPYMLFPGGQSVPTGPVWDYMVAIPAWILGLGAPSAGTIDGVGAWLPAILGALFPIPGFFLARRFFGLAAGALAALWMAVGYGGFLWLTHLGLTDHHAAEGLFALLTLAFLCTAIDGGGMRFAWLGGISMGLFLGIRPAGIFVPATLAVMVVSEPPSAGAILRAAIAAAIVFLPSSGGLWSEYTWLSLAVTALVAAIVLVTDRVARRRAWPDALRRAAPFALMAGGALVVALAKPHLVATLWYEIKRVAGHAEGSNVVAMVQEMQPVYRSGSKPGWPAIFHALGGVWILALPVLVWLLWRPWRPAARLLALWTIVMALGTLQQVRMSIYFLPVASILTGAGCAWAAHRAPRNRQRLVAAALALLVVAGNAPFAIAEVAIDQGVNADWLGAFTWLRTNTPDPLPGGWSRYYRTTSAGGWGVAIWWDQGYELEQVAHRIPMSNGTQSGAIEMARFYLETIPEAAVAWLRHTGGRYVAVDPLGPWFAGQNHSRFPAQVLLLGRRMDTYYQTLYERDSDGNFLAVSVYLPTYYQTMIARLYLSDGAAAAGSGPWVFETAPSTAPNGKTVELILSKHQFSSPTEAGKFVAERPSARLTVGCLDPSTSCIPLPEVKGLKRVFTSDPLPLSRDRVVRAVKIYEVTPE